MLSYYTFTVALMPTIRTLEYIHIIVISICNIFIAELAISLVLIFCDLKELLLSLILISLIFVFIWRKIPIEK